LVVVILGWIVRPAHFTDEHRNPLNDAVDDECRTYKAD
jgi:hypothetical protein